MSRHALKPSELKFIQCHGINNYRWKGFLSGGSFPKVLLENILNEQEVVGKIVSLPSDGELQLWPRLQHENLNPLLEILSIDSDKTVKILLSPAVGKCIGLAIHDISFTEHPLCFERKKNYAKGVISGLSYLHYNSVYLLNLNDKNVEIHAYDDKAVICDFSCMVVQKRITKASLSFASNYKPPEAEVANDDEMLSSVSIDMWYCGLLFLQIFTQHMLPWPGFVNDCLICLDNEVLKKANIGSHLNSQAACDLKKFLQNLLCQEPNLRKSASETFKSNFLQNVYNKMDEKARHFWENGGKTHQEFPNSFCEETKFKNSDESSIYFETDVATVSEDDISAIMRNNEVTCPKINTLCLVRTKSEPGRKMRREVRTPGLQAHASFPSFPKKSYYGYSNTRDERSDCSEINSLDTEFGTLCSDLVSGEHDRDKDSHSNQTVSSVKRSPYDVFLTEWDADILTNLDESTQCHDLEKEVGEKNSISNDSFARRLKANLPRNISKNLLTEDCSPSMNLDERQAHLSFQPSGVCESEPDSYESSLDEDINLSSEAEEQNSYKKLEYTNLDYEARIKSVGTSTNCLLVGNDFVRVPAKSTSSRPRENEYPFETDRMKYKKRANPVYDKKQNHVPCNMDKREKDVNATPRKSTSSVKDSKEECPFHIKSRLSSVQSEIIVDAAKGEVFVSKTISKRRKWYHLLCAGWKKGKQNP